MTQRARQSLISGQVDQNLNQRENCRICNNYKVRIHLQMVWGCFRLGFDGQRLAGNIDPVVAEILPRLILSEQSFWCICCKFSAVSGGRLDQSKSPILAPTTISPLTGSSSHSLKEGKLQYDSFGNNQLVIHHTYHTLPGSSGFRIWCFGGEKSSHCFRC